MELVSPSIKSKPSDPVGWRDVYGKVTYKVQLTDNTKARGSLQGFLRDRLQTLWGNNNGNYIVTLTIKNGTQELAKRAVFSFRWEQSKFLGFTTKEEISSSLSTNGTLIDHFPVGAENNNLQVYLELNQAQGFSFDTQKYNDFSSQVSLLTFEKLLPAVKVAKDAIVPLQLMATLLNSTSKADISTDSEMSFVKSNNANKIEYNLRGEGNKLSGLRVTVSFETEPSLLSPSFDTAKQKFPDGISLGSVENIAKVGPSSAAKNFEEALSATSDANIIKFLGSLKQGKLPENTSPATVCSELWSTTQGYFSNRDAPLVYASYVRRFQTVLKGANAKSECVDQRKDDFVRLNIPYQSINITD
ncbi:hypothetical protein [Rhizobium leguminosarum]|uniref:hypothetical protein n=1 Tax=Rhizobium leguminosarum TaxID=384 RepID=UPI003F9D170C